MPDQGLEWIGRPWSLVEPQLAAAGLTYEAIVTRPPRKPVGMGELRVVAVRPRPAGLSVVLAHRDYVVDPAPAVE
ncbi:MAG TPA: hypothetical protein VK191_02075 [Symbiobacteriaceae bacterium]|nr:hypothetical protein [Symbiobacteriaceae bacterium]